MVLLVGGLPATSVADFTVLGTDGVWLQQNSRVTSGDVGANIVSPGPFLSDGVELTLGPGARVDTAASLVYGNRVSLNISAQVFDVYTNQVSGIGTILGQVVSPLTLPVVGTLPSVPSITPGTQPVIVSPFTTQSLGLGSYAAVTVGSAGTLTLTGGLYEMASLTVGNSAKVHVAAPSELRIAGKLQTDPIARIEPAPGTTLTAADILIVVTGQNGTSGSLSESPKAVSFGQATTVRAKVWAPNGTVELQQNSVGTGAFLGKWVILGPGVFAHFESGFGLTVGGAGNSQPVAHAGFNRSVEVGETVELNGSGSTDEDGDALTFGWSLISQPAGSTATLTTPTKVLPSLTIDQPGDYVVQLLVNDGMVDSDPDTVTLSTGNVAPHANAGPDQTGVVTQAVFLDGTHSTDANGDGLTYQWTLVTKPAGSAAVLNDPTSPTPSFMVDQAGTYTVNLIVSDGLLISDPDTVIIDTTNSKPVANAGSDHTVRAGTPVTLDGTGSTDVDGHPLTYHWVQTVVPPGNTATLSDPTAPAPTLTPNANGAYVVQLQVDDGTVSSDPDTALIRVGNTAPTADAGPDQTVPVGGTVHLDGTNSNDPQHDLLTYHWTLTKPASSTATLSDATLAQPTFVADFPGIYTATLLVNDGDLNSDPESVIITTQNNPPVANAGLDQNVTVGATVQLDGSGSSDPESQPLSYQWSLVSRPVGSTATLGNPTSVTPTFVADVVGTYVVQLIVDDGLASSPLDTATITATNNAPPVANAGADQRTLAGTTIFFNGTGSSDPNGDPLTYQWTLTQKPTGSGAVVSDTTTVSASLVPDVNGLYVLQLVVHDGVVTSPPDTVTLTVGNTPPVLNSLGNQVILLGQRLTFPLTGSDADGDPITFTAEPVVLPTHMVFNSTTGLVTFQPDASQIGNHVVTFGVQDGFASDTETITITVQAPGPGSVTGLTGRLLDTNDFVNGGTETPVVGATVSLLGTGISVTSDAQGLFMLSGLPAGLQVLDIDVSTATPGPGGVTYAGFRERLDLIPNATKVIDRPFFLPRNDPNSAMTVNGVPVAGVDPTQTTIVTNPALSATLTVPPHTAMVNGVEYTGPLSISEVPEGLAPAALPATLKPELLITIQPPGVTFTQALKLTLANREGLATGNDMNLWSLDPQAGAFEVVGVGRISGGLINTISGGVRAADWHGLLPPGVGVGGAGNGSGAQNGNQGSDKPKKKCGSSEIALCTGGLTEVHDLVPYRSLGIERGVQLVYNSRTAEPYVVIEEEVQIPVPSAVPERVSMGVTVGVPRMNIQRGIMIPTAPGSGPAGLQIGPPVFFDTSGLSETVIHQFRPKYAWPVGDLATGSYPVRVNLTNHFPTTAVGIDMYETITINNQQSSPFGAGWSVAGVDRLHLQENGDVVLAQGEGGTQLFRQAKPGNFLADEVVFLNGNSSNPRKVLLADFTNDGTLDLGIPTTFAVPGRFEVHEGLGNGQFQFVTVSTVGPQMATARSADFDEDGLLDLVAASTYVSGFATVAYGDGTGAMQNPFTLAQGTNTPTAKFVGSVAVADVNGDGHQDIAIAYTSANVVDVHLGTGLRGPSGFGPPITSVVLTGSPADLTTADVNQDGHLDLVTANNTALSVLLGDGTGAFPTLLPLTGLQFALTVEAMDLNGDGYPDLVTTGNGLTQNDRIAVFENTRAGGFWAPTILTLPTGVRPSNITLGDVTADGAVDLVVETQGQGFGLAVIHGDGFGGFGTPQIIPIGKKPLTLALGDVDGNGTLDALASIQGLSIGTDHVQVFRNPAPGEGLISPPGEFSTLTLNPDDTYTQRTKTGTVRQFDVQGRQTHVTDRNGNATTYAYDGQDRLTTITDPANLVTTFAYVGGQVTITDPVGRVTRLDQDSQGNLTTVTDPDLTARTFTYDAHHLMTAQVNQRGFRTQYVYNDFRQVVQTLRADGSTNGFTPARSLGLVPPGGTQGTESNPLPLVMEADAKSMLTDGKGQVTTMGFDAFGADTTVTDALGRTTTTTRNDASLPTLITTPNGAITELTYDQQGNLLTRREAKNLSGLDRTTSFAYDPVFSQLTKLTDPDNKVTTIQLDPTGNPLVVTNPLNGQRLRTFNSQGQVLTDQDENGKTTTFTYNAKGNLETLTDAEGHVTRFVRDAAGNVTTLIEGEGTPEQRTRTFTYDTMNRLTSATDGTAHPPTQFAYDAQGNLTTTTLPTSEQEIRTYDPLNRVASIDDPLRGLTTFTYDANGNLLRTVNALNDPTTFAYDAADQLTTITDALSGLQGFAYDVEGNVQTFTDARGKVTTFEYDKLNRQTKRLAPGGTFTTTFTYDKRDNLTTTTDPKNQLITRVYDNNSRLTSITTPDNTITIGYDAGAIPRR
ncbi:MAG: PKD domain-containing protein [Nitrospirales bacterium]|nr:PKD domain-containing protein [Nitrospirales bacterium]